MPPLLVAAICGALLTFALPPIGWWPLAFAVLPLFALVGRAASGRRAFRLGAAFAVPFFALYILWLPRSFAQLFGPSFWLVFPFLLAILATFWGLTTWASWRLAGGRRGAPAGRRVLAVVPVAWVLVEWARTQGYFAFPWGTLGYVWLDTPVAQLADVVGVYGLSLLVTVPAALAAVPFVPAAGRRGAPVPSVPPAGRLGASVPSASMRAFLAPAAAALLVSGAFVLGGVRGPATPLADAPEPPLRALLVQGNVDPFARAVNAAAELRTHLELTEAGAQAAGPAPLDLVVWPEGAVLGYALDGADAAPLRATVTASASGAAFLVGGRAYQGTGSTNAVFSLAGDALVDRYDKVHLVPFGERWPLIEQAEGLYRAVFGLFGLPLLASTTPGASTHAVDTTLGRVAAFICYESVFPQVQRAMVADGAQVLVLPTNDAWFGQGNGARQHFDMGRLRAIETRRWLLRAGNDGVTAAVDPYGRVTAELPRATADTLLAGFALRDERTPWVRFGAWTPLLLVVWLAVAVAVVRRMAGR